MLRDLLFEGADFGVHRLLLALHELDICDHFRHVVRVVLDVLVFNIRHLQMDTMKTSKMEICTACDWRGERSLSWPVSEPSRSGKHVLTVWFPPLSWTFGQSGRGKTINREGWKVAAIEHQSDARLSAPEPQASNPHVSSWLPLRPADYHNLSPSQRETGTPRKPGRAHGNHREQKHFRLIWLPITRLGRSRTGKTQTADFQTELECCFF